METNTNLTAAPGHSDHPPLSGADGRHLPQESLFERYDTTSLTYDRLRKPIALEAVVEALQRAGNLSELRVLEGGCGTGNYLNAFVPLVAQVIGRDASAGMIAVAQAKLAAVPNADLKQGNILALDLPDASVDAYMVNAVLHHIDEPGDAQFTNVGKFVNEGARVIRPGGVISVNLSSPEQISEGVLWYHRLVPEAQRNFATRYVPIETLSTRLTDAGFTDVSIVKVAEPVEAPAFYDLLGPCRQDWRNGDSVFALASPSELQRMESYLMEAAKSGELFDFVAAAEARRREMGETFVVSAIRK